MAAPADMTVRGNVEEGIAQLNEEKYLGPNEEIRQGVLRLQELKKERVRLRVKSSLVEVVVKKLEEEIKEDFLDKKTRVIKQGAHNHIGKFGDYCHELISMMPWLGLHITI